MRNRVIGLVIMFLIMMSMSHKARSEQTIFQTHYDTTFDADYSAGSSSATTSGATLTTGSGGKFGEGVLVDGTDYLEYPLSGNLSTAKGTIEMWVKPTWPADVAGSNVYYFFSTKHGNYIALRYHAGDDKFYGKVWTGSTDIYAISSVQTFSANTWLHLALTWDNTTGLKLYINGTLDGTGGGTWSAGGDSTIDIGHYDRNNQCNAVIDEVRISDYVRYTTNFVVSTEPDVSTIDTGQQTLFLAEYDNAGFFDADYAVSTPTVTTSGVTLTTGSGGKFGEGVLVDGTDYLEYPLSGNLSTAKGTIEMWVKPTWGSDVPGSNVYYFFSTKHGNYIALRYSAGDDKFYGKVWTGSTDIYAISSVQTFSANTWLHLALTWDNTTGLKLYINGTLDGTGGGTWTAGSDSTIDIGHYDRNNQCNAVIDEVRISDYVRYTNNFTPPNTLFLSHYNTTFDADIAAGSSVATTSGVTLTTGSGGKFGEGVLVDGTDYLEYPLSANLSTAKGTIEMWAKPTWSADVAGSNVYYFFSTKHGNYIALRYSAGDDKFYGKVWTGSTDIYAISSVQTFSANTWLHLALTWDNTTGLKLYINGTLDGTGGGTWTAGSDSTIDIGHYDRNNQCNALIDEVRISGYVRYTANFTPPNTLFLAHYNTAFDGDSTAGSSSATSSGVTLTTGSGGKFGEGVLVDGTDYLEYPLSANLSTAKGTIEMWVKPTWGSDVPGSNVYYFFSTKHGNYIALRYSAGDDKFYGKVWTGSTDIYAISSVQTFSANTWLHLALTWDNTTGLKLYINGTLDGTGGGTWSAGGDSTIDIGHYDRNNQCNAVIDEGRISGYVRYAANFTLPSVQYPKPTLEYIKDNIKKPMTVAFNNHTLFFDYLNSRENVEANGGRVYGGVTFERNSGRFGDGFLSNVDGEKITYPAKDRIKGSEGTISTWVKPKFALPSNTTSHTFFKISDNTGKYLEAKLGSDEKLLWRYYDGATTNNLFSSGVLDWEKDELHHLSLAWGSDYGMEIWIDGELDNSNTVTGGLGTDFTNQDIQLGYVYPGEALNMVMSELRIDDCQRRLPAAGDDLEVGGINLFTNSDIEDGLTDWSTSGGTVTWDTTVGYDSSSSVKITQGSGWNGFWQSVTLPDRLNDYVGSFYAKTDGSSMPIEIEVEYYDKDGASIGGEQAGLFYPSSTWTRYSYVFEDVPYQATTVSVRFKLDNGANGTIWVDSMQIEKERGRQASTYSEVDRKKIYIWREGEGMDAHDSGSGPFYGGPNPASDSATYSSNSPGEYATYTVTIKDNDTYALWMRYANGITQDAKHDIYFGGSLTFNDVLFPGTGGYYTYNWKKAGNVSLSADTIMKFECVIWGVNLDAFVLTNDPSWAPQNLGEELFGLVSLDTKNNLLNLRSRITELKSLRAKAAASSLDTPYQEVTERVTGDFTGWGILEENEIKPERAAKELGYISIACEEAINDVVRLLVDNSKEITVPNYVITDITISNGAFLKGTNEVIFGGALGFGSVENTPLAREHGYNLVWTGDYGFQYVVNRDLTTNDDYSALIAQYDTAATEQIGVDQMLSIHYVPSWRDIDYPQCNPNPGIHRNNIDWAFEAASTKDLITIWLNDLIPVVKDKPALLSYCLANEMTYIDYSSSAESAFESWCQSTYGTLNKLNSTWGTNYTAWSQITPPANESNKAMWYDWMIFNNKSVVDFFTWEKNLIRTMDTTTPVHIKIMDELFSPGGTPNGVDPEKLFSICEIIGVDDFGDDDVICPNSNDMTVDTGRDFASFYDLLRSLAPGKPIVNSEFHSEKSGYMDKVYTRIQQWMATLHGMMASLTWEWTRTDAGALEPEPARLLTRPEATQYNGITSLESERLGDYLVEFPRNASASAEVAILWSLPSRYLAKDTYLKEARKSYHGARFLDAPINFVSEEQIANNKLNDYKLLIVTRARHVKKTAYDKIKSWVQNGGTAFITDDCLDYDEHNKQRSLFYSETSGNGYQNIGTGKVYYQNVTSLTVGGYANIFNTPLFTDVSVRRDITITDTSNNRIWGIEARSVPYGTYKITYIINLTDTTKTIKINGYNASYPITDLITGATLGSTTLNLAPRTPLLIKGTL